MNNTAYYENNFGEYEIHKIKDHNAIIIKDSCFCDIVNDDIKKFVFKDVSKSYDELVGLDNSHTLFKFKAKFETEYNRVDFIKIVIRGYNETMDRLAFDVSGLNLISAYKYSISNDTIEVTFSVDDNMQNLKQFIKTIEYEYFNDINANSKYVYLYVNGDLVCNNKIKISQGDAV